MREQTKQLGEVGDPDATPGSREWAVDIRGKLFAKLDDAQATVRTVRDLLSTCERHKGHTALTTRAGRPFRSFEEFCRAKPPYGVDLPDDVVKHIQTATNEKKRLGVLFDDIDYVREHDAKVRKDAADNEEPVDVSQLQGLAKPGEAGNGRSRGVYNTSTRGTTNADYLTARIARDHPAILDRMKAGEFRSVRAAAIEAGIVTPPTALQECLRAWRKMTAEERAEFREWVKDASTSVLDTARDK